MLGLILAAALTPAQVPELAQGDAYDLRCALTAVDVMGDTKEGGRNPTAFAVLNFYVGRLSARHPDWVITERLDEARAAAAHLPLGETPAETALKCVQTMGKVLPSTTP